MIHRNKLPEMLSVLFIIAATVAMMVFVAGKL